MTLIQDDVKHELARKDRQAPSAAPSHSSRFLLWRTLVTFYV